MILIYDLDSWFDVMVWIHALSSWFVFMVWSHGLKSWFGFMVCMCSVLLVVHGDVCCELTLYHWTGFAPASLTRGSDAGLRLKLQQKHHQVVWSMMEVKCFQALINKTSNKGKAKVSVFGFGCNLHFFQLSVSLNQRELHQSTPAWFIVSYFICFESCSLFPHTLTQRQRSVTSYSRRHFKLRIFQKNTRAAGTEDGMHQLEL